ncbi:MAG: thioredoxin family protein, partial [Candidatus Omnitrophica bacterium]|nr:thioredoxin family protein [Candidatus Omnitrophota bacterium]
KKVILLVLMGILLFSACSASDNAGSIDWLHSLDEGLQAAQQQNKPLMVDFFTEWCGFCNKLNRETFSSAQVSSLAVDFICVKVDADNDRKATEEYGIRGFPTVIFLDAQGKEIGRVIGFRPADVFASEMKKIIDSGK